MIESFRRLSRRLRRLFRFAAAVWRSQAEFQRSQRSGPLSINGRVRLLQGWCRDGLAALGVQVTVEGIPPSSGLVASNHLGYLDILVYSSIVPTAFVSKAEVRRWPFIGRFAEYAGAIFVLREDRASLQSVNQQIAEHLKSGIAVVLFPEGTTTDGSHVLRFHSSMLQPAIDAAVPVIPCAISYEVSEGSENEVAWWGDMTLGPHAWNLAAKPSIRASVAFGEPLTAIQSRKELGDAAREQVIELRATATSFPR